MFTRLLHHFESWIDPFRENSERPPSGFFTYCRHFIAQAPVVFVLALIMGGVLGLIEITLFAYVGEIIDLLGDASPETLFDDYGPTFLWMAFFVVVLRLGFMTFGTILDEQVIVPSFFNMVRWQNHKHVMRQSVSFFQNDFAGRIAMKVTQSGQSLGDFLMSLLQVIWLFIIYVTGSLLLFGQLHLTLAAVLCVWCVFYAAILVNFIPRIRRSARAFSEAQATINGRLVDAYSNVTLVKVDGRFDREDAFVAAGIEDFVEKIRRYTRNITGMRFSLHVINAAMVVGVAYAALQLWQIGNVSLGDVAFALGLMLRLTILATRMLGQFNGIFRAVGNIQNAMETITKPLSIVDVEGAQEMSPAKGAIEFRDVHFRYDAGDRPEVIDGFSLVIKPGEKVGIIGASGAGKTTLFNLLLRFYDVNSGQIFLDDVPIHTVTQQSLRANFALVQQETALMNRSIRDNIAYPRPNASEQDIVDVARRAEAHDFILSLEDAKGRKGYDAHVGERGVKLSGGQRQRLALARALLKDAPVVMLDEATSALDSETEAVIRERLDVLLEGKTVLAIAHRLSTIAAMDRLVVLKDGRLMEEGTHESLLQTDGLYAKLWAQQSGGFLNADEVAEG